MYVTLAWELDIADLKKLSLNGIIYSSIDDESKKGLRELFDMKWNEWIEMLCKLKVDASHTVDDDCVSPARE